jgi:CRP/FNR family transcriptional regulator
MLATMRARISNEVDCGECAARGRCWPGESIAGAGFLVRRARRVPAGEPVFEQGSPFDAPCIVTDGCIALIEILRDGDERIVAFRVPGEIVGLESLNRKTHRYGARAVTESALCRLRWNPGHGGGTRNSALLRALLGKAVSQSAESTLPWPGLPAVERVRAFLADFHERSGRSPPLTRAQIGQYLGLAEETVVRAMKALAR